MWAVVFFFVFLRRKKTGGKKVLCFPRKKIPLFANVVAGGSAGVRMKKRGGCCEVL